MKFRLQFRLWLDCVIAVCLLAPVLVSCERSGDDNGQSASTNPVPSSVSSESGSSDNSGGGGTVQPTPTGKVPEVGSYSFSVPGSMFSVSGDTGTTSRTVVFQPQSAEGYSMPVVDGGFYYQNGIVDGDFNSSNWKEYPTDGFRLSGSFVTKDLAVGTVDYVYNGQITSSASFTAIKE